MKKMLSVMVVLVMVLSLVACGGDKKATSAEGNEGANDSKTAEKSVSQDDKKSDNSTEKGEPLKVGVSMPTKSLQRWNQDGSNMQKLLEEAGYEVDLQFAENKVESQVAQIENMVTKGAKIIVVAAIDGSSLSSVLDEAKSVGCSVIAYDRLIMNTDAVSYYATFDNTSVGKIQGEYIEKALDLKNATGPFNFEITTGPLDDNNVNYFFGGAMEVLQPYIDEGKLVVKSGQTTREQCATPNWDEAEAQKRFDNILTANYTSENVDAVLCSNDSTSLGVQSSLKSAGYGSGDKPMPIITGQDANVTNVKAILAKEQSMSIFKDTRALAEQVVSMVDAIAKGSEPEINDTSTYDNGSKVVPSYLLKPLFVDITNYKELLIDSGYYSEADLK